MNFTFGSDPEFMVGKNEEIVSAIPHLPRKESALNRNGHKFYYDNVLAEIAIKPASTRNQAVEHTQQALGQLSKLIKPYKLLIRSSAKYPSKQLTHKEARIAGCNPEWNVYTLKCVLPPEDVISNTSFRTAGGHIHVGAEGLNNPVKAFDVIRMMDLFIGIPALFLDKDETSKERRKIYGHAGSHRATNYGFEYRSLGNFWFQSPDHVELIYDLVNFVLEFIAEDGHKKFWVVNEALLESHDPSKAYKCTGYDSKLLCKTINGCDMQQAEKFLMFINNYLPDDLSSKIDSLSNQEMSDPYETWCL
jgi:hypothetical protein